MTEGVPLLLGEDSWRVVVVTWGDQHEVATVDIDMPLELVIDVPAHAVGAVAAHARREVTECSLVGLLVVQPSTPSHGMILFSGFPSGCPSAST